jgi:hypothetical protein
VDNALAVSRSPFARADITGRVSWIRRWFAVPGVVDDQGEEVTVIVWWLGNGSVNIEGGVLSQVKFLMFGI